MPGQMSGYRAHRRFRHAGSGAPAPARARRWRPAPPAGCTSAAWQFSSAGRVVIIASVGQVDMLFDLQPCGRIDGAERHVELAATRAFPEQFGATGFAEPAFDAGRGFVPGEVLLPLDL